MATRTLRWLAGLVVMLAVAFALVWGLTMLGVPRLIAVVIAILAAASLERTSYARRALGRLRQ